MFYALLPLKHFGTSLVKLHIYFNVDFLFFILGRFTQILIHFQIDRSVSSLEVDKKQKTLWQNHLCSSLFHH